MEIDDRLTIQLIYHLLSCAFCSEGVTKEIKTALKPLIPLANKFHHVKRCGEIEYKEKRTKDEK